VGRLALSTREGRRRRTAQSEGRPREARNVGFSTNAEPTESSCQRRARSSPRSPATSAEDPGAGPSLPGESQASLRAQRSRPRWLHRAGNPGSFEGVSVSSWPIDKKAAQRHCPWPRAYISGSRAFRVASKETVPQPPSPNSSTTAPRKSGRGRLPKRGSALAAPANR
jgi:hypothetical protein